MVYSDFPKQYKTASGRISNTSETLWLSSLPTIMKILSQTMAPEWPQDYVDFSDGHGHIIPLSVVRSYRNSNKFKHVCMCLMPVIIKKNQSKMKAQERPQTFSHCKSMWG